MTKTDREIAIERCKVLQLIIEITKASKIDSTFVSAFLDGYEYKDLLDFPLSSIHGSFLLTGTKSGRLSSRSPNMQNLPSTGSKYAKRVKECFQAPPGWVMLGVDFDSLEDKISALTSRDSNKLKVYTDGYDGHCLRAYAYFGENMPDIDPKSVSSINSIKKLYPDFRQDSKQPTFLLTYDGTYIGIQKQCGFSKEKSLKIESHYHTLYVESDEWKAKKIKQASKDGYVEVAFGLRVRTPLLAKTVLNTTKTPFNAQKEARTAGNALGQSYCMLNTRAALEFMERVENSPYKDKIKLIGLIHDACYFIVKEELDVLHWVNKNFPECMAWDGLPEIQHPVVKLSGALDIFYPSWANEIGVPNNATKEEILAICRSNS